MSDQNYRGDVDLGFDPEWERAMMRAAGMWNRDFAFDELCARYAAACEGMAAVGEPMGRETRAAFIAAASEMGWLGDFTSYVVDYELVARHLPAPDETPADTLSPGSQRALDRVRQMTRDAETRERHGQN